MHFTYLGAYIYKHLQLKDMKEKNAESKKKIQTWNNISEAQFDEMLQHLTSIDLTQIIEEEDITDHKMEPACAGGVCEISTWKTSSGTTERIQLDKASSGK